MQVAYCRGQIRQAVVAEVEAVELRHLPQRLGKHQRSVLLELLRRADVSHREVAEGESAHGRGEGGEVVVGQVEVRQPLKVANAVRQLRGGNGSGGPTGLVAANTGHSVRAVRHGD